MLTDAEIGQVTAGLLQRAVELLQDGALVAFPTDTVYGVGAVVWSAVAVGRLYVAKQRLTDKAIPVLLADLDDLVHVSRALPSAAWCLAERFWPGPLTLIVPRATRVPDAVTAGGDSVAVRIPDHALARSLIRRTGASLATTSANLAGAPNAITAAEVATQLGDRVAMILDGGRCPGGLPSTVVDLTGPAPVVLRVGPISSEQINAALA